VDVAPVVDPAPPAPAPLLRESPDSDAHPKTNANPIETWNERRHATMTRRWPDLSDLASQIAATRRYA
jgi:hypothetical protein